MKTWLLALATVGLLGRHTIGRRGVPERIRGVWQAVQVSTTGPAPRVITIAEPRPNLTIITARHYSHLQVEAPRPRMSPADIANATADELRAVWGPFSGEAGSYEVTAAGVITTRPIVAKNPDAMAPGAYATFSFTVRGDTLWLTEQRNQRGPVPNPMTVTAVRVE